jgi:hypothetical protein
MTLKLRVTPSSPLYQRKKEGLLRVFIKAINSHPDYQSLDLTPLWHTLTLMEPQAARGYDSEALAWLKITFERARSTGELVAQCTMIMELHKIISHVPQEAGEDGESLRHTAWRDQPYTRQLEEDKTEIQASQKLDTAEEMEETHDHADDVEAARMQERATGTGGDENEAYAAGREADRPQRNTGAIFDDDEPLPSLEGLATMAQPMAARTPLGIGVHPAGCRDEPISLSRRRGGSQRRRIFERRIYPKILQEAADPTPHRRGEGRG